MTDLFDMITAPIELLARVIGKPETASMLREAARRIDATETTSTVERASLANTAAKLRARADTLDPQTRCIVCEAIISVALCMEHRCPDGAIDAFNARQKSAGGDGRAEYFGTKPTREDA